MTTIFTAGLPFPYRVANQGNAASLQVVLPNGRNVELNSKEGADEFIATVGTDFISTSLATTNDTELTSAYMIMFTVAYNASPPEKIATGFPESEFRTFVEHARGILDTLSSDRNWLRSGTVSKCHKILLKVVANFSECPSFLKIFRSNEGMEAVARFYASRKKNDTPSLCVAQFILFLVHNALCVLKQEGVSLEKGFSILNHEYWRRYFGGPWT
jgi:hypothetical protein